MKFLLDMGLARSTTFFLRAEGYDAVHLRHQELQRLQDHEIIHKAKIEDRVILTHDLDFGRLVSLSRQNKPSVITFRLENMQPQFVNHYLTQALDRFPDALQQGALISITERAIRLRLLPMLDPLS